MYGKIYHYSSDSKTGIIRDDEGKEYHFSIDDYQLPIRPLEGFEVSFESSGDKATNIGSVSSDNTSNKNFTVKKSKKFMSTIMKISLVFGIAAFVVIIMISEMEYRKVDKLQEMYNSQLKSIENNINVGNCAEAVIEYSRAREIRNEINQTGLYFSIESFEKQAHTLEIAECFAQYGEFANAIEMLDIERNHDANYLRRASAIYEKSGDHAKALEAQSKAQRIDPQ